MRRRSDNPPDGAATSCASSFCAVRVTGPGPMDALSGSSAEGGFAALFAQGVTAAGVSA